MVQAMVDPTQMGDAFDIYWSSVFPWEKGEKLKKEVKVQAAMKKWTEMGPIAFKLMETNPLHSRAKELKVPDEFKAKLRAKMRKQ